MAKDLFGFDYDCDGDIDEDDFLKWDSDMDDEDRIHHRGIYAEDDLFGESEDDFSDGDED